MGRAIPAGVVLTAVLLLAGPAALAGCGGEDPAASGDATVLSVDDLACDHDQTTDEAKTVVEDVGGLATPDWTVAFARSTEAGVVALVRGDLRAAYDALTTDYGVSVVAGLGQDAGDPDATGFGGLLARVPEVVDEVCGR